MPSDADPAVLLDIRDLSIDFRTERRTIRAVDRVGFSIGRGRTLGVVGESGSGKSVTALSILRLLNEPSARIASGEIRFDGTDLLRLPEKAMQGLRGSALAMIFQEPMTSLNPAYTVGDQIAEAVLRHRGMTRRAARAHAVEMLRRVRIPAPESRADEYPHKLSGGMRQRMMIAMALACDPRLLIADEPTTALDVTIQAQILDLLRSLREETGMAILLITHDLGVVAEIAHEVIVMYAGQVVERAPVAALFATPQHPYTIGLLGAVPRLDGQVHRLATIDGTVPSPQALPSGCRFHPRCPFAIERCRHEEPPAVTITEGHWASCWRVPLEAAA